MKIQKLFQNLWEKAENVPLRLDQKHKGIVLLFFFFLFFLPTQFGLHLWPSFSFLSGRRIDYLSPTLYVTDILLFIIACVSFRYVPVPRSPFLLAVCFLPGIFFVSSPLLVVYGVYKYVECIYLAVFTRWFFSTYGYRIFFLAFAAGMALQSVLALFQFYLQSSLGGLWYFLGERTFSGTTPGIANASLDGNLILRPYGTFSHPNVLAAYLLLGMLFLLIFIYRYRIKSQRFVFVVIFVGTLALLCTLSRVPILLWACSLPSLLLVIFLPKKKIKKYGLLVTMVGIIFLSFFLFPRFISLFQGDEGLQIRIALMILSWKMIVTHPLFGIGVSNFLPVLSLIPDVVFGRVPLQPVHNIFLLILVEGGILGIVAWNIVLLRALFRVWGTVMILPFMLIMILGSVDHYFLTLQQGQLLFGLCLGLCWAKR